MRQSQAPMFTLRTLFRLAALLLLAVVLIAWPNSQPASAAGSPQAGGPEGKKPGSGQTLDLPSMPTDQIIVKFKPKSVDFRTNAQSLETVMGELSAAAGMEVQYVRPMSGDADVLRLQKRMSQDEAQAISQRLSALPDVEYAEPDAIMQHTFTPNDPQYGSQWHYYGTYGIDAPAAWDITTGSASVTAAVIDTGITSHPDLVGRTWPGYDFISDYRVGNDGNGRDADPSDPGDWITSAEASSGFFTGCPVDNSSWHGTHTAGTVGAASNNATGVAGINWTSRILPVRVLGKCGGYTSDIADGMRWAAGLPVAGVPAN
ncbi:MAG TPA: S8 family serine peptidase, partial [Anaerolineales bacterium]